VGIFDTMRAMLGISTKASAVTPAVVGYWGQGQAVWTPANYEQLAREGYQKCSWAFRAIQKKAQAASSVQWLLMRDGRDGPEIVTAHPLLSLINNPNPGQGWPRIIENLVAWREISGNGYIEGTGDNFNRPPLELYAHRPDRMRVVVGTSEQPIGGWEYTVGGDVRKLPAESILQWKAFHPLDDWYGLSPLAVAARGIDQFNAGQESNVYLQQNMARPSGILSAPAAINDKAYARLKTDMAENWVGSRNSGKPLLLTDGMTWTQTALTPVELDYIESSKASAEQIVVALGLSMTLLSPTDSTFANMAIAKTMFWQDTMVPLLADLAGELNRWLVPRFAGRNERLYLVPDWDAIEALQENRDAAYKRNGEAFKTHHVLKLNEARGELGWDADDEHGNRYAWEIDYLLRWGVWPGSTPAAPTKPAALTEGKSGPVPSETVEAARVEAYKAAERSRAPFYLTVRQRVAERFRSEKAAVLAAIEGKAGDDLIGTAEAVIEAQAAEWATLLQAVYLAIGETFGSRQFRELKHGTGPAELKAAPSDDELQAIETYVLNYIIAHGPDRAAMIQSTTAKAIKGRVLELIAAGEDADAIMVAVDAAYERWAAEEVVAAGEPIGAEVVQMVETRADTIAVTETVNASELGKAAGADASGLPLTKEWISTRDHRVRPTHKAADGQKHKQTEPFTVGGVELMHPGDGSLGGGSESVRCRCFLRYDLDEDAL
jgi:HK97 family phage portal protein